MKGTAPTWGAGGLIIPYERVLGGKPSAGIAAPLQGVDTAVLMIDLRSLGLNNNIYRL